jgi:hypothetical protein
MRSLGKTKLSNTRLQTSEQEELLDMDSHIPLSISDIIPQGKQRISVESTNLDTPEDIKNAMIWNEVLKSQNK